MERSSSPEGPSASRPLPGNRIIRTGTGLKRITQCRNCTFGVDAGGKAPVSSSIRSSKPPSFPPFSTSFQCSIANISHQPAVVSRSKQHSNYSTYLLEREIRTHTLCAASEIGQNKNVEGKQGKRAPLPPTPLLGSFTFSQEEGGSSVLLLCGVGGIIV